MEYFNSIFIGTVKNQLFCEITWYLLKQHIQLVKVFN